METTNPNDSKQVRRCGAETRDGTPCEKYPAKGATRCRFHGGASTGPKETDALSERMQGNDYAVGNDGGAPELNTNAQSHGGWGDWRTVYERLEGDRKAWVDELAECHIDNADLENVDADSSLSEGEVREKAVEAAVLSVLERRAHADSFKRGWVLEEEVVADGETYTNQKVNPALDAGLKHSARQRNLLSEIGVYPVRPGGE